MSKIFFDDTYISVVPEYDCTGIHRHSMLHIFVGNEPLILNDEYKGKLIILEQNVMHARPKGDVRFFMFIDPTSEFAEILRRDFLKGEEVYVSENGVGDYELSPLGIKQFVRDYFGDKCFIRRTDIDDRIMSILDEASKFKYLDTKVSKLAEGMNYSESYLTHLFKKETGVSLKQYLLLRRVEYVWIKISSGSSITEASLDAGFASPSHFADTCKKLMGISAADVLRT
ncbi:MAG: helix-turn-helix domain-containing protein [Eubacterium sp.]|nr:helix-turn-helix domain-containing protein [Eubacterium sp.]